MEFWMIAVVVFLLVIDTVVSFVALFRTIANQKRIFKNSVYILKNKMDIRNIKGSDVEQNEEQQ